MRSSILLIVLWFWFKIIVQIENFICIVGIARLWMLLTHCWLVENQTRVRVELDLKDIVGDLELRKSIEEFDIRIYVHQ